MRTRFASLVAAVLAVALTGVNAEGQWTRNTTTTPPTTYTTDPTDNVIIGDAPSHPYARLTLAGAEMFRIAPNPVVRLLELDFNHYVGAVESRNGAAFRIDLRSGPSDNPGIPIFNWYIRAAGEPLPTNTQTEKMFMDRLGNLAIGFGGYSGDTSNKLQVNGAARVVGNVTAGSVTTTGNITANGSLGAASITSTGNIAAATISAAGNLSAGTISTASNITASGNVTAVGLASTASITATGNITANGTISGGNVIAKYQDVAEWVPSADDIEAATVVVVDPERPNHVVPSSSAYDETVAGIVSARPGIVLGEAGAEKVKVATTGRVKVKVDATKAPIHIGDLLVTSDKPGVAMKSERIEVAGVRIHRPGTVVGKALEPLASGEGEILVLLSLQ